MKKTTFTIENERADHFEQTLLEFDLLECINSINEFDFWTHFIFDSLNDDEEEAIQNLLENL